MELRCGSLHGVPILFRQEHDLHPSRKIVDAYGVTGIYVVLKMAESVEKVVELGVFLTSTS